jgi:hypothetical protein
VGFAGTFALLIGVFPVFGWAVIRAQERFGKGQAQWQGITARWPPWVERVLQALTYYAVGHFVYVLYLHFVQGTKPSMAVWARFYSAYAVLFYFAAVATLWAMIAMGRSASVAAAPGERGESAP